MRQVAAEPAASLACVARGKGWHLLPAPLRLQLLDALGERHALSDALSDACALKDAFVEIETLLPESEPARSVLSASHRTPAPAQQLTASASKTFCSKCRFRGCSQSRNAGSP